jgi:EAL domain-containing protein (putative c-di-GMP-specific phosphodiesterase class I)
VCLSIDDFGTGYSSLSKLRALPISEIKLDKSFVLGMTAEKDDATIVRSTIELGHNLGLRVVAEGIETDQVAAELLRLGCDVGQGYWLARPQPPAAMTAWLRRRTHGAGSGRPGRATAG